MSRAKDQYTSYWKIVQQYIVGRTPLWYDHADMVNTSRDTKVLHDAYLLWYIVSCDTLSFFGETPVFPDWRRWIDSITSVPVVDLVDMLKEMSSSLVVDDFVSYDAFKQHLSVSYPFAGRVISPVRKVLERWWREGDTVALTYLYTWATFISHVHLQDVEKLAEQALQAYLDVEDSMQIDQFTDEEHEVIRGWYPYTLENMFFFSEEHIPEHGSGSTSDCGSNAIRKYLSLWTDQRLEMLLNRIPEIVHPRKPLKATPESRTSKTIFVAKSLTKHRTISMEPATLMWHQKGVRRALLRFWIERKHYMRRRYRPEDQEPNRNLAWEGSLDGEFATIDLSSASDMVAWPLVRKWFRGTCLYPWLLWVRSTHTWLPDGRRIELRKYAPMGSDLCFPIECIVFAAIVECSIREVGEDPVASRYRVYGDDIVVEQRFAATVIDRLTRNGFKVNTSKSFLGRQSRGFFRESCGGYYFDGVDITPVRLSRKFTGLLKPGEISSEKIQQLIELANESNFRFPGLRLYLVQSLIALPKRLRPIFSDDGSCGLFSKQPTNFHLLSEESSRYQATYLVHGGPDVQYARWDTRWDDIRLFEHLRLTRSRRSLTWPEDRVKVNLCPVIGQKWVTTRTLTYR